MLRSHSKRMIHLAQKEKALEGKTAKTCHSWQHLEMLLISICNVFGLGRKYSVSCMTWDQSIVGETYEKGRMIYGVVSLFDHVMVSCAPYPQFGKEGPFLRLETEEPTVLHLGSAVRGCYCCCCCRRRGGEVMRVTGGTGILFSCFSDPGPSDSLARR